MNKQELRAIAEAMITDLRECEDGTSTTTRELLIKNGYDEDEIGFPGMMELHRILFRLAGQNRIKLDMSAHEDLAEGMPYDLDFVVRNKKAQIKCPRCGSTNTARYQYGYPAFSDDLQKKLDEGKIVLGGCCIVTADVNGQRVWNVPARKCNGCGKDFGKPALIRSKEGNDDKWFMDEVRSVKLSILAFSMSGNFEATVKKTEDGAVFSVSKGFENSEGHITDRRWYDLLDKLFNKYYLPDWKKNYKPEGSMVLDGESWLLEIKLADGRQRTWRGDNAYPVYWKETLKEFRKLK